MGGASVDGCSGWVVDSVYAVQEGGGRGGGVRVKRRRGGRQARSMWSGEWHAARGGACGKGIRGVRGSGSTLITTPGERHPGTSPLPPRPRWRGATPAGSLAGETMAALLGGGGATVRLHVMGPPGTT